MRFVFVLLSFVNLFENGCDDTKVETMLQIHVPRIGLAKGPDRTPAAFSPSASEAIMAEQAAGTTNLRHDPSPMGDLAVHGVLQREIKRISSWQSI